MQKFKVEAIKDIEGRPGLKQVMVYDSRALIILPDDKADTLNPGDKIFTVGYRLRQPLVFLWRNGMEFRGREELSYRDRIGCFDGIFSGSLDRLAIKKGLIAECWRLGIQVSLAAWRNLKNILEHDALLKEKSVSRV